MRVFLLLIICTHLYGNDNHHVRIPEKHHYQYDYRVHYCNNNEAQINDYYEQSSRPKVRNNSFKRKIKRIKTVIIAIIIAAATGIISLFEKL